MAYRFRQKRRTRPWQYVSLSIDRKSTRLNSSHVRISYAVFCLKKKKKKKSTNLSIKHKQKQRQSYTKIQEQTLKHMDAQRTQLFTLTCNYKHIYLYITL